jgi:murein DD-endopeptidase MepM/ murein hydrolase activator NlpD
LRLRSVLVSAAAACIAGAVGITAHVSLKNAHANSDTLSDALAQEEPAPAGDPSLLLDQIARAFPLPDPEDEAKDFGLALPPVDGEGRQEEEPASDGGSVAPGVLRQIVSVGRGDTLLGLLVDAAVPREEAVGAIDALRSVYNPRKLQVGQEIALLFEGEDEPRFLGFEFEPNVDRAVAVARGEDSRYAAREVEKPLERRIVGAGGVITSSLFEAGSENGVPVPVMTKLIRIFSYDVDFQRDIQPGDGFEVMYERDFTEDGTPVREGEVLFASLRLSGRELAIYRYTTRDGVVDYFNRKGESVRKALLRTPIDGARMSSGFGMRRHPILGYSKMHKGTDFAAPTGTPIYAAGNGVVEEIGRKGGYGNYIRIRHNKEISTAYAHMSRFNSALKRGARVSQGDVIGYVGTTGQSTGPHLHYEVLRGGRQVNPMSVDLPTGITLEGRELAAFRARVEEMDRQLVALGRRAPEAVQTVSYTLPPSPPACKLEMSC